VVKAKEVDYDHTRLREREMRLFGAASDNGASHRSLLRLRLDRWEPGSLSQVNTGGLVCHPNVANDQMPACPGGNPGRMVGAHLYLGFGPVAVGGLARPPAIAPRKDLAHLRIACPDDAADELRAAMQLAAWFGTLGSRSRNGWGAVHIEGEHLLGLNGLCDTALARYAPPVSLDEAIQRDWPHAIGLAEDGRPAVWRVYARTEMIEGKPRYVGFDSWAGVMERLAEIKIGFRTQFNLEGTEPHNEIQKRHVLAYPITHHGLQGTGTKKIMDGRLANQVRFKVACARRKDKTNQDKDEYFGVIVHLPCAMPRVFFEGTTVQRPDNRYQVDVWREVHHCLNTQFPEAIARIRKA
jgi:CRISPR-associated protein Cmr1